MLSLARRADQLLRSDLAPGSDAASGARTYHLLLIIAGFGLFYGAVMGMFALAGDRWMQVLYSAVKVPLLLLLTFVIALPSYWVLNTLLGVGHDFPRVLRALCATQAGLTILLASLAPFTAFWYASVDNYESAVLFNALTFAIASVAAQFLLRRYYRPLIALNPRHRLLMRTWLLIFAFVGIQMGWVLRPFVGNPDMPTHFFRQGAWGNAYVEIVHIAGRALRGGANLPDNR